jgi:hypothetical protein
MLGGVELTQAAREHAREMLTARDRAAGTEKATGSPATPRRGAGNSRGGSARKG